MTWKPLPTMPEVSTLLAPKYARVAYYLTLLSPKLQTWIRIPVFCITERKMRFSSLANPNSYIVGLYQEQRCHADSIVSPVWKKAKVVRTNADSSLLQNTVGLRSLSRNFSYFLSQIFLFPSSNAHTKKRASY